jgi:Uma2 family endonuclease
VFDLDKLYPWRIRPLRRVEYDRLVELGLLDEDEHVELLYGRIVEMSPQGTEHAWVIQQLTELLVAALAGRAKVRPQLPLALSDVSEPEPDLAIVPVTGYQPDHPSRALLVIEVADSSLRGDRVIKGRLYAESGIPEFWLVNLVDGVVEVHRDPTAKGYLSVSRHSRADVIRLELAGADLRVSDFLPPAP